FKLGASADGLEVTPLKVNQSIYFCTTANEVVALDAETGKQRWRFNPRIKYKGLPVCRGVAYYRVPNAEGACAERIISSTLDGRLIALDANDGKPCADFGRSQAGLEVSKSKHIPIADQQSVGQVSLLKGMGETLRMYYPTSAPTIVKDKIVVGGMVRDA